MRQCRTLTQQHRSRSRQQGSSNPSSRVVTVTVNLTLFLLTTIQWHSSNQAQDAGSTKYKWNSRSLFTDLFSDHSNMTTPMSTATRLSLRSEAKRMFTFGWDNYVRYGFPLDELDPIHCTGRGPDYERPENININDVLGDYCLTLVDSLDTLAVMGNKSEFHRAVDLAIEYLSFERENTVQVFEATIRVLGALISAHLILTDPAKSLGDFELPGYRGELLSLARDLADRLVPAFEETETGIPHPRVNLAAGIPTNGVNSTCTAGAGSLLLEFGLLSRLLNDTTFEQLARRSNRAIFNLRDKDTGLFGNTLNIQTGEWEGKMSGVGAGIDSFYEYLLKSYILFGDREDYVMFNQSYSDIKDHLRRGRHYCNGGLGDPPIYVNVDMTDGQTINTWIDSLQAAFAGVQVLNGDIEEAICHHALYYSIWKKYGMLPERYNWHMKAPDVHFYPLRPEFAESTYLLYRSTRNPFYLHVGREILNDLEANSRVECGYATVHDVFDKTLEDRMESFFLSETCKYLYLLYDFENPVNVQQERFLFSTEGHIIPIDSRFHRGGNHQHHHQYNHQHNHQSSNRAPSAGDSLPESIPEENEEEFVKMREAVEAEEAEEKEDVMEPCEDKDDRAEKPCGPNDKPKMIVFDEDDWTDEEDNDEGDDFSEIDSVEDQVPHARQLTDLDPIVVTRLAAWSNASSDNNFLVVEPGCDSTFPSARRFGLPLHSAYLSQYDRMVGLR